MTMPSAHENVPLATAIPYRLYNEDGTCIYTVHTYTDDSVWNGYSRCIVADAALAIVNVLFAAVVGIYHRNILLKQLLRDYGSLKTTRSYMQCLYDKANTYITNRQYHIPYIPILHSIRSGQYVHHQ